VFQETLHNISRNLRVFIDLLTSGEFTSFSGNFGPDIADHTQIVIGPNNDGMTCIEWRIMPVHAVTTFAIVCCK